MLRSGRYLLGPEAAAFEGEFARYLGVKYAVGVASGADALCLALRVSGIGPGDVVVTVSWTAAATVAAILSSGARPLLIDIDPESFTMDPQHLQEVLKGSRRIRAIIPVHLYGRPADVPAIVKIARSRGLVVIEDCSQSHGASIRGRKVGSWGEMGAFSFYPTKNLGALGNGGMVVTDNPQWAQRLRELRMSSRLDELQAAVLRVKLRTLDRENERRRQIAFLYNTSLCRTSLILPGAGKDEDHVYHQYVVRSSRRDGLRSFLKSRSIETLIHYPYPVHRQQGYRHRVAVGPGGLRHTEHVSREVLSLPIHPELKDSQCRSVARQVGLWDGA